MRGSARFLVFFIQQLPPNAKPRELSQGPQPQSSAQLGTEVASEVPSEHQLLHLSHLQEAQPDLAHLREVQPGAVPTEPLVLHSIQKSSSMLQPPRMKSVPYLASVLVSQLMSLLISVPASVQAFAPWLMDQTLASRLQAVVMFRPTCSPRPPANLLPNHQPLSTASSRLQAPKMQSALDMASLPVAAAFVLRSSDLPSDVNQSNPTPSSTPQASRRHFVP